MTITYPLAIPSSPYAQKSSFRMNEVVAVSESPFSLSQQAQDFTGQRWEADIQMPPMRRQKAELWLAFFSKLKGRYGTFLMGDFDGQRAMGTALGTPLVNGAGQTGGSLATKGWTANKTGLLLPGDYIMTGSGSTSRLYKCQDQVDSDGSGHATINIWPNLRYSPADSASIYTSGCVTQFRLVSNLQWSADEVSTYGISFSATEAL